MSECIGSIGKRFGHNFETYLIKKVPPVLSKMDVFGVSILEVIESLTEYTYAVRCARCGEKLE